MKTLKKFEQGFTLIELVVVLAVFSIILAGLLALYHNYNKIYNVQEANSRVIGAASFTGSDLQYFTGQAVEVMASHNFSGTTRTTDSSTLVLRLPAIDSSGSTIDDQFDYVAFYVTGQKLFKQVLPHASSTRKAITNQLSDTVVTATFSYNNANFAEVSSIEVNILMQLTVRQTNVSQRLQQTLYLRNK